MQLPNVDRPDWQAPIWGSRPAPRCKAGSHEGGSVMLASLRVESCATIEGLVGESDDRPIPTECQSVEVLVVQAAKQVGLLEGDSKPHEHIEPPSHSIFRREARKAQVSAVEFRDVHGIA